MLAWRREQTAGGILAQGGYATEKSWSELYFMTCIQRIKKSKLIIVNKVLERKIRKILMLIELVQVH